MAPPPALSIATDKVCFLVAKAREFDVKDVVTEPDPGSNPSDDGMVEILEDHADDPVLQEITALITGLSEDEKGDLLALTWLGRGDGDIEDWSELRDEALRLHGRRTAAYLIGLPMLSDLLTEGLAQFGRSCVDELE